MYTRHKFTFIIICVFSILFYKFVGINYKNLITEVIYINLTFIIIYTISLKNLINNSNLCKKLSNEQFQKFSAISKLKAITIYYKIGYLCSILSIVFIYISNLLLNINLQFILYLFNCTSFMLLNVNYVIFIIIIKLMLNYQLYI